MNFLSGNIRVSVVIPAYNVACYIEETVESLLQQTYPVNEILIIEDCSKDSTYEVVKKLGQEFPSLIRVYQLEKNSGVSAARNRGIELATEEWILLMDGDDIAEPNLIEKLIDRLADLEKKHKSVWGLIHSATVQVNGEGKRIGAVQRWKQVKENEVFGYLLVRNMVASSGVLIKKEIVERAGKFNPDIRYSEDWDLWLRMAQISGFGYVDDPLVKIRRHSRNASKLIQTMLGGEKAVLSSYSLDSIEKALQKRELGWEQNCIDFASILYRLDYWDEGYETIKKILEAGKEIASAFFLQGLYFLHKTKFERASETFRKVIEIAPEQGAALNNLAILLALENKIDKAVSLLKKSLELFPGYQDAGHNLSLIEEAGFTSYKDFRFTWRELRPVLVFYSGEK